MAKRPRQEDELDPEKSVRDEFHPKGRKGGVAVRVKADYSRSGRLLRYSMVLIDTHNTAADNGRVLGYDNSHGRHYLGKVDLWSLNPMRARKSVSRPKSGSTSKRMSLSRGRKIRIGIESMDRFFSRMRANARKLDRDERPAPGLNLYFEDP